jgi:hypothetical protein
LSRIPEADLLTALESEVFGEAIFRTMAYTSFDAGKREKARALWRLETQTKERILEYYQEKDYTIPPFFLWKVKGMAMGLLLFLIPWKTYIEGTLKETDNFLEVFRRLEANAGNEDAGLFAYIVAHEVAIQQFAKIEFEGGEDSLAPVNALLAH